MKKTTRFLLPSLTLVFTLLILGSAGCTTRLPATPEITPIPPTPEATATATTAPARIVLFDPASQSGSEITGLLTEFAAANSIGFETWSSLTGSFDGIKIFVVYGTLENLTEIAAATPQTQFVVISQTIVPAANISVIGYNPTHLAFLAGYLAAMTSDDWRAGALMVIDPNLSLANAFTNGGQYLCGSCTPQYTPMLNYPQVYTLPSQSGVAAWSIQATALITDTAVNSVYIDPDADYPEVLDLLPNAVLYSSNPASANITRYTAILGAEVIAPLQQSLPDLLAGNGRKSIAAPVGLIKINNTDIVSSAKQALLKEVSQKLADGLIIPNSVP